MRTNIKNKTTSGFTLVELLVVITIIVLFSTTILAILTSARTRAEDLQRVQDANSIHTALELYYDDFEEYPRADQAEGGGSACPGNSSSGNPAWCGLVDDLAKYIVMPSDPVNHTGFIYRYDSDLGDNYQTYGFMVKMRSRASDNFVDNDNGYFNSQGAQGEYYEIGQKRIYCGDNYSGTNANWYTAGNNVCVGGS